MWVLTSSIDYVIVYKKGGYMKLLITTLILLLGILLVTAAYPSQDFQTINAPERAIIDLDTTLPDPFTSLDPIPMTGEILTNGALK